MIALDELSDVRTRTRKYMKGVSVKWSIGVRLVAVGSVLNSSGRMAQFQLCSVAIELQFCL